MRGQRRVIGPAPAAAASVMLIMLVASVAAGQDAPPVETRNFDVRTSLSSDLLPETALSNAALEAFAVGRPELAINVDPAFGTTTKLWDRLGYLTDPDPREATEVATEFLAEHLAVLGLDEADFGEYEVRDLVVNQATGSTHLYLRQLSQEVPLYNGLLQVNVNRDGRIMSVNNAWIRGLAAITASAAPALPAGEAVLRAARHLEMQAPAAPRALGEPEGPKQRTRLDPAGFSLEPIEAELYWLPVSRADVRLVWGFQLHTSDLQHAFDMTVDAASGQVWTRFDWVAGDSYRVYQEPAESPIHVSPVPPSDGRTLVTNPADATASPFGWHDTNGAAGAEYTIMRGNNVHAYDDIDNNGAPPAVEPDCGGSLVCDFPVTLNQEPNTYIQAAVANLFYWNNYIHDSQYHYGFTETAGNFQANNYGRGGAQNDDVRAEAQDGGGINNANFLTPGDGARPRMQMFLWNTASPQIDGDFDNGIIVHEYGHGISNRLVGGPASVSCLNNLQQPGEGLSDWWGLVYTAKAGDVGTTGRGIGTYALNQPTTGAGIRAQRYSTNPAINTWTYASINGMSIPHGVGSVFAQAGWEMYWALVDAHGFNADLKNGSGTAGNQRALLYMNAGLMNTNCSPTFLDVRDGIIQAATNNHGGADVCLLWSAFAGMGMGTDAVSGGANSTAPTNGTGMPGACLANAPAISINDVSVTEGTPSGLAGATASLNVSLSKTSTSTVQVGYATADGTASSTSNATAMTLPGTGTSGAASLYPSTITISGADAGAVITDLDVVLTGLGHTYPADLDIVLQGPTGATVLLMSDAGGGTNISNVTMTFDDAGAVVSTPISTGTYRPTNVGAGDTLVAPAPAPPYGTSLSVFNGTNPNGTWRLFIQDDAGLDAGALTGGWELRFSPASLAGDYVSTSGTLTFSPGATSRSLSVTVAADARVEPNETVLVNLSNAVNATVADAQGVVTIVNDDFPGAGPWTDDSLTTSSTEIKAVHVNELRSRIATLRQSRGLSAVSWTDPTLSSSVTIKAVHITELRTALAAVYTSLGQSVPAYADSVLTAGMTVMAVHVTQLRAAVAAVE